MESNIPQIIDKKHLPIFYSNKMNIILYQLQFIFNALDQKDFSYHFHEYFLRFIKKIKLVNVPDFKTLTANIKSKNVALIMQMKLHKRLSSNQSLENDDEKEKDLNTLKKDELKMPEKFKDRQKIKSKRKNSYQTNKKSSPSSFQTAESFWNTADSKYKLDKGVLYDSRNNNAQNKQEFSSNKIKFASSPPKNMFTSIPKKNKKSKLFKFFHYNEQIQKWEMDSKNIYEFTKSNLFEKSGKKISLIFYLNSNESELITLNSNLMDNLYPDLDDENIYVYALCDRLLSLLNFDINNLDVNSAQIIPVFLLLHVPENKKNLNDIRTILLKIYYFLSFICDIEISIFNKDHSNNQLDLLNLIYDIKSVYCQYAKENFFLKPIMDLKSELVLNDDSDYDNDDNTTSMNDLYINLKESKINNFFENADFKHFKNETRFIVLMNDESINNDIIMEITKDDTNFYLFALINVNEAITYRPFLTFLTKCAIKSNNEYKALMSKFELFPMTEINSKYIDLRFNINFESELKSIIYDRFNQYKESNKDETNEFILLSNLFNEITIMNPLIDQIFHQKSNLILDEIKQEIAYKNKDIFISELNKSSQNNLSYLKKIILDQFYWSPEKKDLIINSHDYFLKNELFSIISSLYTKKEYPLVLQSCNSILENQVNQDRIALNQFFVEVENKYKSSDDQVVDFIDEMNKGTNYSIRETERVKEIKVIAEAGHLQDIIPQDF